MILVEADEVAMEEAVVEKDRVDTFKICKVTRLQKIQVVAKEEDVLKEGETQEEEVDGNRDKTIILMHVKHVVGMDIIQMNAIISKMIGDQQVETSKGIMHLP